MHLVIPLKMRRKIKKCKSTIYLRKYFRRYQNLKIHGKIKREAELDINSIKEKSSEESLVG